MFLKKILLFTLFMLVLTGCAQENPPLTEPTEQELVHIRLPMGYIPSVQYAPFYYALEKGYYRQAGFDVEFDYQFETDGVALVGANELPFAIVSAEQVPLARAQGLPVVYIMSWWHDFPVAIASLKEANIKAPQDLKGKKIGIPGLFGASYVGLRALLKSAGMKEQDVELDSIGFNQVEALVSGQEDAVVIYANNEPIQLEARGYGLNTILVSDYLFLASNGLIANEKVIAENPDMVRRFVQATLRGLRETIDNPDEAFEISRKYVEGLDQNADIQRQVLAKSIEFWKVKEPGVSSLVAWDNMVEVLVDMGMLKQPIELEKAFTNEFVR
jgi:NitT/TauT family transport system substrate-binding protein